MSLDPMFVPGRSRSVARLAVLVVAGWAFAWGVVIGLWGWRLWREERLLTALNQQGARGYRQSQEVPLPEWLGDTDRPWGPRVLLIDGIEWFPRPDAPAHPAPAWSQLRRARSLQSLSWGQTPTDEDWRHLEALTSLRELSLRSVTLPTGTLARIARLPRLESLRLDTCQWSAGELAALANARQLRALALDFSPVEREELLSLTGLPQLRSLSLTGCGVSEATTRDFLQHCPRLDLSDD